jgi:hypothetical protein
MFRCRIQKAGEPNNREAWFEYRRLALLTLAAQRHLPLAKPDQAIAFSYFSRAILARPLGTQHAYIF